ncbi:MAG: alpha-amylase family glycosyl hydrolase [Candidatus Thioglobus sp.]|nr:alpha-amylase family glycosyl hydrolase [Candidatus Thioglobus sp.]
MLNQSKIHTKKTNLTLNNNWWKGGVIYQVYPRSYQDSNGDGVGDLTGITQRLPYIASLGVDAVWISPFYKSPMKDFGYDVSDYRAIDPMFGTMDDFDAMLAEAHGLGLRIMIDLVLSHTSDQHAWFNESRTDRTNPKNDWYVWADAKPDGTPPNNWLAMFGGSSWKWDGRREQYFLHNFLSNQPDLNVHCQDVQDALLDVARFWLDKGVDGFRFDTINFFMHDKLLRDNPPVPVQERNHSIATKVNPYNWQNHIYSKNQPENIIFLERIRALVDQYEGRACLGEVGDAQRGMQILGEYTSGDKRIHMCYAFEFLENRPATAQWVKTVFDKIDIEAPDGWICWAFSNHDVERLASRWSLNNLAKYTYAMLLHSMRGSVCIYQGEELGLMESEVSFENLQDPYGIEFWPEYKGRDGCRTPMVWQANAVNADFSTGKPWLPVCAEQSQLAVDMQESDEDSMLHFFRKAIALRKALPVLQTGTQISTTAKGGLLSFIRGDDSRCLYCAFNLSDEVLEFSLPSGNWQNINQNMGKLCVNPIESNKLGPWQFCFALKDTTN